MKLSLDYKKQFKLCFVIIFFGISFMIPILFSNAQVVSEIKSKIEQKNAEIDKLEQEINQYQYQLNELGKKKNSLNVSLAELDLTRKKLTANISVTEKKIYNTNLKIEELGSQIGDKQDSISNDVDSIILSFKKINELENESILATILSKNNFTEIWNDVDNMINVRTKIKEKIKELKKIKGELENTKTETTNARNELIRLKTQLADQKKIVEQNTIEKKNLLAQTKNNEANYQQLLKDRLAKKDAFEKEIRDYESQLKYILDPSKLPGAGVLSWPLDSIYITQVFGKTEAGKRLYANGTHNGVDFRASVGTRVLAMADGVVAGTGDTDLQCTYKGKGVSFGRFVLIKYNNGLASTFGHLSLIKVTKGDKVSRGQIVGYSGNTGYSTGPHLHVSVYARDAVDLKTLPSKSCPGKDLTQPISAINAYLDPMYYLPPYK